MALKKVKGNFFERMFDKNLTDLVRGIRNNKDNEVSVPRTCSPASTAHQNRCPPTATPPQAAQLCVQLELANWLTNFVCIKGILLEFGVLACVRVCVCG